MTAFMHTSDLLLTAQTAAVVVVRVVVVVGNAQPSGVSCLSRPESKAGPERERTGAWRLWAQLPNHNALPARN